MATDPQRRGFALVWGVAIAVGAALLLATWTARSFSMPPGAALAFAGCMLCGPFARWFSGPMGAGEWCFAIFLAALLAPHFVRPCAATVVLTFVGAVLWVLSGWFWLVMLA